MLCGPVQIDMNHTRLLLSIHPILVEAYKLSIGTLAQNFILATFCCSPYEPASRQSIGIIILLAKSQGFWIQGFVVYAHENGAFELLGEIRRIGRSFDPTHLTPYTMSEIVQ
jgi:hypothetical protein